jgi:hypothetical protein
MQREREQGLNLTAKQPTVEEFAQTWLEDGVKRTCKASTHTNYTNVMPLLRAAPHRPAPLG